MKLFAGAKNIDVHAHAIVYFSKLNCISDIFVLYMSSIGGTSLDEATEDTLREVNEYGSDAIW